MGTFYCPKLCFGILQRGAGADQRGLGSTPLIINFSRLLEAKFKLNPSMKENRLDIFKLTSKLFKSAVSNSLADSILLVSNGSFLLNLPLVNHEHRKLADHVVRSVAPAGRWTSTPRLCGCCATFSCSFRRGARAGPSRRRRWGGGG